MPMPLPPPGAGAPPQLGPPGQPPSGSSPMTMPMPHKGMEVAGLARLGVVVKQLTELLPILGVNSEPGKDVMTCLTKLAKHVPDGTISPGLEQSAMQRIMEKLRQQGPQIAQAMQQRGGGGMPPGAGPPGAGAPPPGA